MNIEDIFSNDPDEIVIWINVGSNPLPIEQYNEDNPAVKQYYEKLRNMCIDKRWMSRDFISAIDLEFEQHLIKHPFESDWYLRLYITPKYLPTHSIGHCFIDKLRYLDQGLLPIVPGLDKFKPIAE